MSAQWNPRLRDDISDALVRALPFPTVNALRAPAQPGTFIARHQAQQPPDAPALYEQVLTYACGAIGDPAERERCEEWLCNEFDWSWYYALLLGRAQGERRGRKERDALRRERDYFHGWCWALALLAVGVVLSGLVWVVAG